jgi:FMN reductase
VQAVVVVGNPKQRSRTRDAGERLAAEFTDRTTVIEVAALGPGLLGWGDPAVADARGQVQAADLAIVASPTFKGTYSGLLKVFLDQFAGGSGMAGVVAVPLMLGAGPAHALAPDLLLKPVLVELGATCPTRGLFQLDATYSTDDSLAGWLSAWRAVVVALTERND